MVKLVRQDRNELAFGEGAAYGDMDEAELVDARHQAEVRRERGLERGIALHEHQRGRGLDAGDQLAQRVRLPSRPLDLFLQPVVDDAEMRWIVRASSDGEADGEEDGNEDSPDDEVTHDPGSSIPSPVIRSPEEMMNSSSRSRQRRVIAYSPLSLWCPDEARRQSGTV